ncbi:hypothetical protein OSTOST_19724, partial [Ostertagia ostertagi]
VIPNYRKPLVVVAPKILLRHSKVILTSGKHWIAVEKERDERGLRDTVAIIRLESLCPFPVQDLRETLQRYPKAT